MARMQYRSQSGKSLLFLLKNKPRIAIIKTATPYTLERILSGAMVLIHAPMAMKIAMITHIFASSFHTTCLIPVKAISTLARNPVQFSTTMDSSWPMVAMPTGIAKILPAKPVIPLIR